MRIKISILLVALSFQSSAELPRCDKCIETQDIAPKAVTTGKIAPDAITKSRLAPESVGNSELVDGTITAEKFTPEVQQRIQGLVVTDGVGRVLPVTVTHTTSITAYGYYTLENKAVIPVVIEKPLYSDQPAQLWTNSGQGSGPWPYNRFAINSIHYTGAGCTGQAFVIGGPSPGGQSVDDFLFDYFFIVDSEAPNRSRLIFKIGSPIVGLLTVLSTQGPLGCTDANPNFRTTTENAFKAGAAGIIRWVPPLTISAP